ncbi:ATP-dependent RNA helicase DDX6/DHH1 [Nematocida parisii]|uniref:RNA helicase n=1 Tax=Nematocida parisii (strain ERTm3) TaxID=935791 RepID=I3EF43_NEMP3|nr:RNA helicase [Nematocida parisii ERTm1]EIJ87840.1 RNA helicase [Nematocida parisii ERTm3]KAI5129255.1 ATP-dependent RNA helicase DDX6/DHH1 [Nematocida parisii]EIJ93061.1 RNA helicase [Nematocida parisii ERTm1]KAI5129433.1 ATP-dependent RNA helicase DDX6/DHH1 [Nematocida parisii]KAI5141988.1 ATP-dependent RNA helicase DDX6/DHH1 [Nematocida parisii]|eukprot:XP_013059844.1 RNA helicase [Nematocida parisii ERTm1]
MKKEEERQQLTISADTRKPSKERASKKKSKPIIKEPERKEKIKEGEIIKIKEQIDTLLEKLEKMERTTEDISVIDIKCSLKEPNNPTKPEIKPSKEFTETVKEIKKEKREIKKRTKDVYTEENGKNHKWTDYKLKKEVLLGIQKKGFHWPSPVQSETIPYSLANKNIVARAKNGTGKTAAFTIPLLNKINPHKLVLQALILVPTRELVLQTAKVCKELGEFLRLKILPLYGGVSAKDDIIRLKGGAHIIIGTPGRVLDFITQKVIVLDKCKYLICDEADKLLSMDFKEVVYDITEHFPKQKQIEMYSATFPAMIQEYIDTYMPDTVKINLMKELTLSGVRQYYAYVKSINKLHCLKTLLTKLNLNQCFIFCNSIQTVERLAKRMTELGFTAYYIHSKMKQEDRNLVFHNFTSKGECRILVSTDLVTRGIDVPSVNVVINFDLPQSTESYLHRIGRSGRFGTEGTAVNMVTPEDVYKIREIESNLGIDMLPFSDTS